jgi:hypothetical protein
MPMNQENLNYQRNIIFSFYSVITGAGALLFLFFITLFILTLLGIVKPEQVAKQMALEKRYAVNLKRERELPKKMADNINQNNQVSDNAKFISDKNSKSVSNKPKETNSNDITFKRSSKVNELNIKKGDAGNSKDGKSKKNIKTASDDKKVKSVFKRKTSIESQFGNPVEKKKAEAKKGNPNALNGNSYRNSLSSSAKSNGAEILGTDISLSTYAWEWYPYIQKMKEKMYQFWAVPPAYRLGLIYGASQIKVTISQSGKMVFYKMVRHQGSKALQKSSENVILAIFDLPPLPQGFPEPSLGLTMTLYYPRLK